MNNSFQKILVVKQKLGTLGDSRWEKDVSRNVTSKINMSFLDMAKNDVCTKINRVIFRPVLKMSMCVFCFYIFDMMPFK